MSNSAVSSTDNDSSFGLSPVSVLLLGNIVSAILLLLRRDSCFRWRLDLLLWSEPEEVLLYLVAATDRQSGLVSLLIGEPRGVEDSLEELCSLSASS